MLLTGLLRHESCVFSSPEFIHKTFQNEPGLVRWQSGGNLPETSTIVVKNWPQSRLIKWGIGCEMLQVKTVAALLKSGGDHANTLRK